MFEEGGAGGLGWMAGERSRVITLLQLLILRIEKQVHHPVTVPYSDPDTIS